MLPSIENIKPDIKIPEKVFKSFTYEYPWCSNANQFHTSPKKDMESILFLSILDLHVTWCTIDKLQEISNSFIEISNKIPNAQTNRLSIYLNEANKTLLEILQHLKPKAEINAIKSQKERIAAVKEKLNQDRNYIQILRSDITNSDKFSKVLRAMAIITYLGSQSSGYIEKLVKKYGNDKLILALLTGQQLETNNPFLLEDHLILPISSYFQMPMYFYLNSYESGPTLPKRRVHASNEPYTLVYLIQQDKVYQMYDQNIAALTNKFTQDYYQVSPRFYEIKSPIISLDEFPQLLATEKQPFNDSEKQQRALLIDSAIDYWLAQTIHECSKVNEIWIQKINEIIQDGKTQPMRRKPPLELSPNLVQNLKQFQKLTNQDQLIEGFQLVLQSKLDKFEEIVIQQVGQVRDNLQIHIQKIQNQFQNNKPRTSNRSASDYILQEGSTMKEVRQINSLMETLPTKPRCLDQRHLFNKYDKGSIQNSFQQQKSLSLINRIEAKSIDQDLPDPIENIIIEETENEDKNFSPSPKFQENHNPSTLNVQYKEYNTDDEPESIDSIDKKNQYSEDEDQIIDVEALEKQEVHIDDGNKFQFIPQPQGNKLLFSPEPHIVEDISKPPLPKTTQNRRNMSNNFAAEPSINNEIDSQRSRLTPPKSSHKQIKSNIPNDQQERQSFQNYLAQKIVGKANTQRKMYSSISSFDIFSSGCMGNSINPNYATIKGRESMKMDFKPNESRKSINQSKIKDRMTSSARFQSGLISSIKMQQSFENDIFKTHQFQKITMREERESYENVQQQKFIHEMPSQITEKEIEESMFVDPTIEFVCPICYDSISSPFDIKNIHGDHKVCENCLQSWIKVKFNSGQWNLKFFVCPITIQKSSTSLSCPNLVDPSLIQTVLSQEEWDTLTSAAMKDGVMDLLCPWEDCQSKLIGMPPLGSDGVKCPNCNGDICLLCREKSHNGKMCPQRINDIKDALQDERIGCCPECLEIFMKSDGCQHVQCVRCAIDFCFECCALREPIIEHGAHYHRIGCSQYSPWINPTTDEEIKDDEYDPDYCSLCKANQQSCKRPINLDLFKQLAHINF